MNIKLMPSLILICSVLLTPALAESIKAVDKPSSPVKSSPDKYVYIISPADGEVLHSPVLVKFGLRGMGVAPAGVERENTGHHHLLIDIEELPDLGKPVPADAQHKHFGAGQTEALVELAPGPHTLQLLFADFSHIPHDPAMTSQTITIFIEE
jgi:hypothetical protein